MTGDIVQLEPWIDKGAAGDYFACSERWLENRIAEGMPYAIIAGRVKFRVSEVEPWLIEHGYMVRRNCA